MDLTSGSLCVICDRNSERSPVPTMYRGRACEGAYKRKTQLGGALIPRTFVVENGRRQRASGWPLQIHFVLVDERGQR